MRELRSVVEQQQGRLNDLQLDVNEIRIHYSELRRELRTIKVHILNFHDEDVCLCMTQRHEASVLINVGSQVVTSV